MRLTLVVLFFFLSVEPMYVEQKGGFQPEFRIFKSEAFNLEVRVPWAWKVTNSGSEGFMISPKKETTLVGLGGTAIPYIEVYKTREGCTEVDSNFHPQTIPPSKVIVYHERLTCRGSTVTVAVYWQSDPEKEKTRAILEEMLSSLVPIKSK